MCSPYVHRSLHLTLGPRLEFQAPSVVQGLDDMVGGEERIIPVEDDGRLAGLKGLELWSSRLLGDAQEVVELAGDAAPPALGRW